MTAPPTAAARKRAKARSEALRRKAEAQAAERRLAEALAEQIAPRAQRRNMAPVTVVGADGKPRVGMLPAARLAAEKTATGKTRIVRANVVRNLAARQAGREGAGKAPMVTAAHVKAADLLILDWDEVNGGVNVRPGNLLASGGRTGRSGAEGTHTAIQAQIAVSDRLRRASVAVGILMDVIEPVVLRGVDLTAWATARGWDRNQAVGYLAAGLHLLVEFYDREASAGKRRRRETA